MGRDCLRTNHRPSAAVYGWGLALAAVLIGLLLLDNRNYLLETPLYEHSDQASNSLFVREAKSGGVIHGHYSRWNFYHPGPVLFYTYALGEVMLYDWLGLVPAPFNGQIVAESAAVTLLFSLAIAVFAARLGGRQGGYAFFLPLALMFAVWHYGAARVATPFMGTWPACTPALVFLCFVVAAASVASGSGRELPLVAFCGGWLVHNHVAQPLFVVPMTLGAYGGLLASCQPTTAEGKPVRWAGTFGAGWRSSPRAHLVAAGVLALFILPVVVVDALHGEESNFQRILEHMRRQHGPMHKLVRSFCYFLTFGSYEAYSPPEIFFGKYSAAGMLAFVGRHWRAYGCWSVTLAGGPFFLALGRRRTAATPGDEPEKLAAAGGHDTFLRWSALMTAAAFALTLFWGIKQDGDMLYFNAYFNFSIYYCVALGSAAGLAVFLQSRLARRTRLARGAVSTLLLVTAGVAAIRNADSFKSTEVAGPEGAVIVKATIEAAEASVPPDAVCYLDFDREGGNWGTATGIALQLARVGYRVRINDNWGIMFGERRTIPQTSTIRWSNGASRPTRRDRRRRKAGPCGRTTASTSCRSPI